MGIVVRRYERTEPRVRVDEACDPIHARLGHEMDCATDVTLCARPKALTDESVAGEIQIVEFKVYDVFEWSM